jgi:hypothetical protein
MDAQEKIQYVKDLINEKVQISPKGRVHISLHTLTEYEDGPTLISRNEQGLIIKKLEEEGHLQNVEFDDNAGVWVEPSEKKTRRSNLLSHIKTSNELLQHRELFEKFLKITDAGNIKPKHIYVVSTEESNDDLIQLLIDLKLVEYDWDEMKKQTHHPVGSRIIEFKFEADKIIELYNRISGKSSRIKREALELISRDIGGRFTLSKIIEIFTDFGVPKSMFIQDTKWRAVFYVLSYYTSAKSSKDYLQGLRLIQETLHSLMFQGDELRAEEVRGKYRSWLKYNQIQIDDGGKIYIGPTEEEYDMGITDIVSVDGEVVEPKGYSVFPDRIAELWVLWSQVIVLTQAYLSSPSLDRAGLEKTYLKIISRAENIIKNEGVGKIAETYKRPFTSLATAEVEALAKNAEGPLTLVSSLLLQITELNPSPEEIAKKLEDNSEFITNIAAMTRAISGEKLDPLKLSYEQAVFILKLVVGHLLNILDAVCTGYINMTDEHLNAQYVILSDNLTGLLERKDLEGIEAPDYMPKHLFEAIDEMDVWWENGGQSRMMSFYGDIETMWIRTGRQTFPVPQWFVLFISEVENSIAQHKKVKAAQWSRMMKNIDDRKKQDEFGLNGSKTEADNSQQKREPLHIIIDDIKKDIGIRGLEEKVVLQKSKNRKIQLRKFPADTKWEDITIRFLNGEDAIINVKSDVHQVNYEVMGFEDEKKKTPNQQWAFLRLLASKKGEVSWNNNRDMTLKQVNSVKKQKQLLAEVLKTYFQIDEDPFENYRTDKAYKIKIKLTPEDSPDIQSGEFTEDY